MNNWINAYENSWERADNKTKTNMKYTEREREKERKNERTKELIQMYNSEFLTIEIILLNEALTDLDTDKKARRKMKIEGVQMSQHTTSNIMNI